MSSGRAARDLNSFQARRDDGVPTKPVLWGKGEKPACGCLINVNKERQK